jgi:hypothetical protein
VTTNDKTELALIMQRAAAGEKLSPFDSARLREEAKKNLDEGARRASGAPATAAPRPAQKQPPLPGSPNATPPRRSQISIGAIEGAIDVLRERKSAEIRAQQAAQQQP